MSSQNSGITWYIGISHFILFVIGASSIVGLFCMPFSFILNHSITHVGLIQSLSSRIPPSIFWYIQLLILQLDLGYLYFIHVDTP